MARSVIDELITLITFKTSKGTPLALRAVKSGLLGIRKAGLIAGAAVAGLGFLTAKVDASVDAQAKFAKSIGVSFENLQELQVAGKFVGASVEDINSSLETLTKTMTSPIPGEYNRELLLLGIRIRDANNHLRPATALLLDISQKMKGLSAIQQIQIGEKLGLNTGTIRLLQRGPKAIETAMKRAKAIGGVLPEGSGKIVANFDTQLDAVIATIKGLVASVVIGLTPAITKTVKAIEDFIAKNQKLISQDLKTFIQGVFQGFKEFFEIVMKVGAAFSVLVKNVTAGKSGLTGVKEIAFAVKTVLIGLGVALFAMADVFLAIGAAITLLLTIVPKIISGFKKIAAPIENTVLPILKKLKNALNDVRGAFEKTVNFIFGANKKGGGKISLGTSLASLSQHKALTGGFRKDIIHRGASLSNLSNSRRTTNNVTIHVNGSKSPKAVASEIQRQLTLNQATQISAPGLNRPAVG